jgi:hypothetical protein
MIQRKHFIFLGVMAAVLFGLLYWMLQPTSNSNTSTIAKVEKDDEAVENVNFQLIRLDRELIKLKDGDFSTQYSTLKEKYGEWIDIYLFQILGLNPQMPQEQLALNVQGILKEKNIAELDRLLANKYANTDSLKKSILPLVGYWNKYFPKMPIKRIVTLNSIFGLQNGLVKAGVLDDSTLFISLECFLGGSFDYNKLGEKMYAYQRFATRPEYLVPTLADAALGNILGYGLEGAPLIDQMVYWGKWNFVKKRLLPDYIDSLIIELPGEKVNWCLKSEGSIWGFLTSKNVLFSNEIRIVSRYINDAPFTPGMPKESPGKIGRWIGWRMVEQYMNKNSDQTIDELLKNQNFQLIVKESGYKPKTK